MISVTKRAPEENRTALRRLRPLDRPRVLLPPGVGERRRQSIELADVSVAAVTIVQLLLAPHRTQGA
eukprot:scaffold87681_cov69-Phaeocystis_antarctica.AAC.5